jgi:hypothetical protein
MFAVDHGLVMKIEELSSLSLQLLGAEVSRLMEMCVRA